MTTTRRSLAAIAILGLVISVPLVAASCGGEDCHEDPCEPGHEGASSVGSGGGEQGAGGQGAGGQGGAGGS
jgi:hypothetical protein